LVTTPGLRKEAAAKERRRAEEEKIEFHHRLVGCQALSKLRILRTIVRQLLELGC
jgi:16S rRNA U1498 N3-methylase RsmE